ncbi:DUF2066 domain-containing protein [Shewanella sp. Isolate11]|uniref:DUF2066 domain-containing protein n=1 Tax=Shewanella sp. Isolate11 TaxID=2908530 RepID=UPI001EFE7796|nr:DUF2066 domain-containing protein [Shewanella sp. Isolate11]MCG9696791.1 DUF2066 domain-containing protein [Shewanella sp. Isolate11]
MFKTLIFGIFTASIVLMANATVATERLQLDESVVKVDDRTTQTKNAALQQALRDVILKNSGSESALDVASINSAISNPTSYIRQFGYQDIEGQQYLRASFDQQKIIKLLRDAQLPVWGKQRPLTLMWLADHNQGEFNIVSDASDTVVSGDIRQISQSRGMPMLLPLMDLDDAMFVGVNDVRGMFADQVAKASQRYNTDYFIMASVEINSDNKASFNMVLYPMGTEQGLYQPLAQKSGVADTETAAIGQMLSAVSEFYAARYAVADSGESLSKKLTFIDLSQRKQLVDIEKFLTQLSAVKSVSLIQLKGSTASFSLELFGSEADLKRLLNLESKVKQQIVLQPNVDQSDPLAPSQTEVVNYIWLGQ